MRPIAFALFITACAVAQDPPRAAPTTPHDAGSAHADASAVAPLDAGVAALDASPVAPTCDGGVAPASDGTHASDPSVVVTATSDGYVLHKELAGFGNYGNPDRAADTLYTGETGAWTFSIPAGVVSATIVVQIINDDHGPGFGDVPLNLYSYRLWGASCPHDGAGLPHGAPYGEQFPNWEQRTFPADGIVGGADYTVTLTNTSTTGPIDWIAIDWIEIRASLTENPN